MTIRLRTVCPEYVGGLPNGSYEVPDGATAREALYQCIREYNGTEPERERLAKLMFLRGSSHIPADTALSDGDSLAVLRPLYGG